jgi:uncharacterized protein (DUF1800 family)
MAVNQEHLGHLLRRAGFGASAAELSALEGMSTFEALAYVIDADEDQPDDVDSKIGQPDYINVTARGPFSPNSNIEDARQRWLFRMVHSRRQLQEKMALFWHNHFATAYSKVAGTFGPLQGTKMMALKTGELPGPQGQIETFREMGLGSFRDLLMTMARDPAMLVWLDGRTNTRQRPQENFGREIMELFTLGVGHYTEEDVYAAARVFTGWNLRLVGNPLEPGGYYEFAYVANNHDGTAKTFTFPIYRDGSRTIPSRAASAGMQDGLDFINALATHPATAERLVRKLWNFFVSEVIPPDPDYLRGATGVYFANDTRIKPLVQYVLQSRWFQNPGNWHSRYAWPVEFAVRAVKEVGFLGFSVDNMRGPLIAMGQTLFEPPDVNGWELGQGWFSTGGMLARMNFASTIAANQRFNLASAAAGAKNSPDTFVDYFLGRLSPAPFDGEPLDVLRAYLVDGGASTWTGSTAQLQTKGAGLARLIVGSAEYQLM